MKKTLLLLFASILLIIAHSQNVGIGTTAPAARLQVVGQGSTSSTNNLMLKNAAGDTLLKMLDNGRIGIGYNAAAYSRTLSLGGNGMNFYYPNNGALAGAIFPVTTPTGINSLRIEGADYLTLSSNSGYVGINRSTPDVSLDVFGGFATSSQITIYSSNNTTVTLSVDNGSFLIVNNTTAVDKNIILSDGLADGQRLTVLVRNSGTGTIIFIDNPSVNNTDISAGSGSFAMSDDDTISFIWDAGAGYWVETGRSDN